MKGLDIFCASQASTEICMSMDQPNPSSSTDQLGSGGGGGPVIDRHNPIIHDARRSTWSASSLALSINPPCSITHLPINPKPYNDASYRQLQKAASRKSDSEKHVVPNRLAKLPRDDRHHDHDHDREKRRFSFSSTKKPTTDQHHPQHVRKSTGSFIPTEIFRRSCAKPDDLAVVTPPGSSRYLLSEPSFLDPDLALVPAAAENVKRSTSLISTVNVEESGNESKPSSNLNQVAVDLRVSLHCKGCERKVRKHLSRIQGVTSFSIDFAAKKVTVIGDITPLNVLESVSKVKNAQFWTPATSQVVA